MEDPSPQVEVAHRTFNLVVRGSAFHYAQEYAEQTRGVPKGLQPKKEPHPHSHPYDTMEIWTWNWVEELGEIDDDI